ncbi:MAG TPA: nitrilase-related carbon-nitrogen hydrolase [Fimbriimonadaceae bacterium]|nr:nitrilase-related carbon-nitrogen hydrolase [Fimbriimonadaceae bacterium]
MRWASSVQVSSILLVLASGALSGFLLALSLPPSDGWWLGPVCLAPVLAAVGGRGLMQGFIGGITVPFVAATAVRLGLILHGTVEGGSPEWLYAGFGFFGFAIALVCCVASEAKSSGWRRVALLGAVAVLLEFALFPILPAHLALTQYRQAGMLFLASVGGIWLVSLVLWAANASFAEALRGGERRPAYAFAALLVTVYALGFVPRSPSRSFAKVAAIQTQATDPTTLRKLNALVGRQGVELAVWPEFSGLEIVPRGDTTDLRTLSAEPGQPPFVTTFRDNFEPLPHNAAALFDKGVESAWYFKRKVFGGESNMHTPGMVGVSVPWPGHPNLGLGICYDSCYPRMMADTAAKGAGLIALPTIDPDAADCFIAAAHAAFTPFRAAESGISIVRADGIAYSQIVDNSGHIVAEMGPRREGVLIGSMPTDRRWTLYSLLGDWVLYLCGLYILGMAGSSRLGKRP